MTNSEVKFASKICVYNMPFKIIDSFRILSRTGQKLVNYRALFMVVYFTKPQRQYAINVISCKFNLLEFMCNLDL